MKHIIILIISTFLLFTCKHTEKTIKDLPQQKIVFTQEKTTNSIKTNVKEIPDYIIDDFEEDLHKWQIFFSKNSKISINLTNSFIPEERALIITYELASKMQSRIEPDKIYIKITKKNNFNKFKGITFYAKSDINYKMRILLFETNKINNNLIPNEIWYKDIKLTNKWEKYKLSFKSFQSEEYYEQDFIGDNIQDLGKINKLGIYVDNSKTLNSKKGKIFIDNIHLY